jgi:hypothetical protein
MPFKPTRGGFLRPIGCGIFIRDFLAGLGPLGSIRIDAKEGACQADIFFQYKTALARVKAEDMATRDEERQAKREKRKIDPDKIASLTESYLQRISIKSRGARYHSFVMYFSTIQNLGWVKATGKEEPSEMQETFPSAPPRRFYRLTPKGRRASEDSWAHPFLTRYPQLRKQKEE